MVRRPPRSTLDRSSAASEVYKRQVLLRLDATETKADQAAIERELAIQKMQLRRIDAELQHQPLRQQSDDDAELLAQAPVSYTHLRAHETVLDLVCRLLLEKNKNIKKTQINAAMKN